MLDDDDDEVFNNKRTNTMHSSKETENFRNILKLTNRIMPPGNSTVIRAGFLVLLLWYSIARRSGYVTNANRFLLR